MNAKPANTGSDWSKVDAHVIQSEECDELPESGEAFFEHVDLY